MSHITLAQQGLAAADAKNWDEAVTKLSKALQSSTNPAWLLGRSKALINLKRYDEALADANLAWHKAYERNKRPLMVDAHYRCAVAYFRQGQLANADCCCIYAMRLIKGNPAVEKEDAAKKQWANGDGFWTATVKDAMEEAQTDEMNKSQEGGMGMVMAQNSPAQAKEWRMASTLRIQVLGAMARLPEDDEARKVTVDMKPETKELADLGIAKDEPKPETAPKAPAVTETSSKKAPAVAETPAQKPVVPKDTPIRLQEFQSSTTMNVSLFTKGVDKEKLNAKFTPKSLHLDPLIYPSGDEGEFQLDLWGEIDTDASKYTVTPNKVELSLVKKTSGKWPQLRAEEGSSAAAPKPTTSASTPATAPTKPSAESAAKPDSSADAAKAKEPAAAGPSYPSSSRSGPKNWDNIDLEGGSDDEGGDVNFFFKKLFKDASPEQQRAMMKSFTESNGTSLSTDWNDVKDRKVETVPPDGVQAKKWE